MAQSAEWPTLCVHSQVSQSVNYKWNGSSYETLAHLTVQTQTSLQGHYSYRAFKTWTGARNCLYFSFGACMSPRTHLILSFNFLPPGTGPVCLTNLYAATPLYLGRKTEKETPRGTELTVICQWESKMTHSIWLRSQSLIWVMAPKKVVTGEPPELEMGALSSSVLINLTRRNSYEWQKAALKQRKCLY